MLPPDLIVIRPESTGAHWAVCFGDGCRWYQKYDTQDEAEQATIEHRHSKREGTKMALAGKTLSEKIWDSFDACMDELMALMETQPSAMRVLVLQGQCQGFAISLHTLLAPRYADPMAVAVAAEQRWKDRQEAAAAMIDGEVPA
jgi:hypothetical protein